MIDMLPAYITAFIGMIVVVILSSTALHFAQYKKRGGCCADAFTAADKGIHPCKTCKCKEDA